MTATSRFIASGAEEDSFDEEDSGALVLSAPIGSGEIIACDTRRGGNDGKKLESRDREITKTILFLAFFNSRILSRA